MIERVLGVLGGMGPLASAQFMLRLTLLTPAARLGLLPGVLRAELLAEGRAVEADLTLDDLSAGFLIGNALRGLMTARLLA